MSSTSEHIKLKFSQENRELLLDFVFSPENSQTKAKIKADIMEIAKEIFAEGTFINRKQLSIPLLPNVITVLTKQKDNKVKNETLQSLKTNLFSVYKQHIAPITQPPKTPNVPHAETNNDMNRLYAAFVGEHFIGKSKYEGVSAEIELLSFVSAELEKRKKEFKSQAEIQTLLDILKKSEDLEHDAKRIFAAKGEEKIKLLTAHTERIVKTVGDMSIGETLLLCTGWVRDPDIHIIYISITRKKSDDFEMKIFNTGQGSVLYHAAMIISDPSNSIGEPKYAFRFAPVTIQDISLSNICCPFFWKGFFEIKSFVNIQYENFTTSAKKTNYSPSDFYKKLLPFLKGNWIDQSPNDPKIYQDEQDAGVCLWASLRAFLKQYFSDNDLERFSLHLEIAALEGLLHSCNDSVFLRKSYQHSSVRLKNGYAQKLIPLEQLEQALKIIEKLEQKASLKEQIIEKDKKNAPSLTFEAPAEMRRTLPVMSSNINPLILDEINPKSIKPDLNPVSEPFYPKFNPVPNLISQQLKEFCEKFTTRDRNVALSIRSIIVSLPLSDGFWKDPSINMESCMKSILTLSRTMIESCEKSNLDSNKEIRLDFIVCLYKCLAIQHMLALQSKELQEMDVARWKIDAFHFLNLFGMLSSREKMKSLIFDREMNEQANAVLVYFNLQLLFQKFSKIFFPDVLGLTYNNQPGYHRGIFPKQADYYKDIDFSHVLYKYFEENKQKILKAWGNASLSGKLENDNFNAASLLVRDQELPPALHALLHQDLFAKLFLQGYSILSKFVYNDKDSIIGLGIRSRPGVNLVPLGKDQINGFTWLRGEEYHDNNLSQTILPYRDLVASVQNSSRNPEELVELQSFKSGITGYFPGSIELRVVKAIEYFSKNLDKLSDPDLQRYLRDILCNDDHLVNLIKEYPGFVHQICSFLSSAYKFFEVRNDLPSMCFMIYASQLVQDRMEHIPEKISYVEYVLNNAKGINSNVSEKTLLSLLKKCKTPSDKTLVYRQLVYCYFLQLPKLKDSEVEQKFEEMVTTVTYVLRMPSPINLENGHLVYIAHKLSLQLHPYFKNYLKDNDTCAKLMQSITRVLEMESPHAKTSWNTLKWELKWPHTCVGLQNKDIECAFNLQTFSLYLQHQHQTLLPYEIISHPDFQRNFPEIKSQVASSIGINVFEFLTDKNEKVRIVNNPNQLMIQMQFKDSNDWYEYGKNNFITSRIDHHILRENKTMWAIIGMVNRDKWKVVLCNPGTSEITHSIRLQNSNDTYISIDAKQFLFNIVDPKNPSQILIHSNSRIYDYFKNFEDKDYIYVWADSQTLKPQKIAMSRLSLSFNIKNGKAYCEQIPGFYIAEQQYLKPLGELNNFLLLKNENEAQKVLIPRKPLQNRYPGGLNTKIFQISDFPEARSKLPPYFEYAVNPNGELEASNEAAYLYLVHMYLGQRQYRTAQLYLRDKCQKVNAFTLAEKDILSWMVIFEKEKEDNDPKAVCAMLTAVALFWKNHSIHGSIKQSLVLQDDLDFVLNSFKRYLKFPQYMGDLFLTEEEELTLLQELLKIKVDVNISATIENHKLLKTRHATLKRQNPSGEVITKTPCMPIRNLPVAQPFKIAEIFWKQPIKKEFSALITRQENQEQDFISLYKEIHSASDEKLKVLAKRWQVMTNLHSGRVATPFGLLTAAATKRNEFPRIEKLLRIIPKVEPTDESSPNEYQNLMTKARDIYNELFGKQTKLERPSDSQIWPLAPQHSLKLSQLDRKEINAVSSPIGNFPKLILPKDLLSSGIFENLFISTQNDFLQKMAHALDLELNQKEIIAESTIEKRFSKKLKEELHSLKTEKPSSSFELKSVDTVSLLSSLTSSLQLVEMDKRRISANSNEMRNQILDLVNKKAGSNKEATILHLLSLRSTQLQPITLDELFGCLLNNNFSEMRERNPLLAQGDYDRLVTMVYTYLLNFTLEQKINRQIRLFEQLISHVQKIPKGHNAKTDNKLHYLGEKLVYELNYQRDSNSESPISFLMFEASKNYLLHAEQCHDLKSISKAEYLILQKWFGTGKTDALLPLGAFARSNRKKFPLVITPPPLFKTIGQNLNKTMTTSFKRHVQAFSYDRNTDFTVEKLLNLKESLEIASPALRSQMLTLKSTACLILKFIESGMIFSYNPSAREDVRPKLQLLQDILNLIKKNADVFIDEADLVLNAKSEVNFTFGEELPLQASRLDLIAELYQQLCDPKIHALLECDPLGKQITEDSVIDRDLFDKKVKPILIPALMEFINKFPSKERVDLLALLKEEVDHLLPFTLNMRYGIGYGLTQKKHAATTAEGQIAIPYTGNDSPAESSIFSSNDVLVNTTIQSCWKSGIKGEVILSIVNDFKKAVQNEMETLQFKSENQTKAYQQFQELRGKEHADIELFTCSLADAQQIASEINASRTENPIRFFKFLKTHVLSKVKINPQQISINAIDIINLLNGVVGYSATPWDKDTYSEKLRTNTHEAKNLDGKTATLLFAQSQAKEGIRYLTKSSFPEILTELIRPEDSALIDTGAVFNGLSSEKVARAIINEFKVRKINKSGVIFFHHNVLSFLPTEGDGNILPLNQSHLEGNRYTYYDQPHATGMDIEQPFDAQATQTMHKDANIRDWFQGSGRMRQIDKKQRISLCITVQAKKLILQKFTLPNERSIKFSHLLRFANYNQSEQLLAKLLISTKQKISVPKQVVLEKLLTLNFSRTDDVINFIKDITHILVTRNPTNPAELYADEEISLPKADVIRALKSQSLEKLQQINPSSLLFHTAKDNFIATVQKRIDEEMGNTLELLPEKLSSHLISKRNEHGESIREQVKETDREKLSQRELESLANKQNPLNELDDTHLKKWREHLFPLDLQTIFAKKEFQSISAKELPKVLSANETKPYVLDLSTFQIGEHPSLFAKIAKGLLGTSNSFPIIPENPGVLKHRPQLPEQYVLFIHTKKTSQMQLMLLDITMDLNFFWRILCLYNNDKKYISGERDVDLGIATLKGVPIIISRLDTDDEKKAWQKALKTQAPKLIVQTKLFRGSLRFSASEIPIVEEFIKDWGADTILNFYQKHIFIYEPKKLLRFQESALYQWLKKPSEDCKILPKHAGS